MEFVEPVVKNICLLLNQLTFTQYLKLFGENPIYNNGSLSEHDKVKNQYQMMKRYTKKQIKNNYNFQIGGYAINNKEYGRQYVIGDSLQTLNSKIRGALVHGIMYDYDIIACHHCILTEICKDNNISCSNLCSYIDNREDKLNDICIEYEIERDEAKNYFIKILFDESYIYKINKKRIKNDFFLTLQKEIKDIQNKFYDLYPEKVTNIKKKGNKNIKGRLLSYVLASKENEILEYIINKFKCNVKIFDGFLSTIHHDVNEINKYCNEQYKYIKWAEKDLNTDILDELENIDLSNNVLSYCGDSVKDVALFLLQFKFTKLFKCYDTFYFHSGDVWINNEKELKRLIKQQTSNCDLYTESKKSFICLNDNVKGVNDLYEFIINHTPINNNLLNNIWENTIRKLYFKNGYYDFKDNKFKSDNRDTTFNINRNLNMQSNKQVRKEIYDRILLPIFSENTDLMNSWLYEMSQVLAGHYENKNWYCLEGLRNSGKGILSDLLIKSFNNYIQITNADNFIYKESTGDSAKANSFLVDFEFARLVLTQEISLKESGTTYIDGNKIKKFCSGGDMMEARKNYQDEKRFRLQCALMLCCNDLPERKPADCNEFLRHYIFNSKFVNEHECKDVPGIKYYEKDNTLKSDFLTREEVQNEFVLIIIEHYNKPVKPPTQPIEELEEENDYKKLFSLFEFTKRDNDIIFNNDLFDYVINKNKLQFTKSKITRLLKSKGASPGVSHSKRFVKGIVMIE